MSGIPGLSVFLSTLPGRRFISALIAAVAVPISINLSGCQTTFSPVAVKADLPPALPPVLNEDEVGRKTVWQNMKDGSEITYELLAINDTTFTGRRSDGCVFSYRKDDVLGPNTQWKKLLRKHRDAYVS